MPTALKRLLSQPSFPLKEALKLIELSSDPNTLNSSGETLIHLLIGKPHRKFLEKDVIEVITTLVRTYGADINKVNKRNKTPLQAFMDKKEWATMNALTLIELGADPKTLDATGQTLVHKLVSYDQGEVKPHNKEAVAKLVRQYGVDIHAKNSQGKTAFQCFLEQDQIQPHMIAWFLSLGADPATRNSQNLPLIHLALKNPVDIRYLLENHPVDVNTKNKDDKTPLHFLMDQPFKVNAGYSALQLIKFNADPNTKNTSKQSLLHLLAQSDFDASLTITELVRTYKADILIQDGHELTPMQTAINAVQTGNCHPNNLMTLLDLSLEFHEQIKIALESSELQSVHDLNLLMTKTHAVKGYNTVPLQAKIREIAFDQLQAVIKVLPPEEQIGKLQWARKQPLFCMHRSEGFFATIGRTQTVINIDKMIADLNAVSTPPKLCGLF